MTKIAVHLHLYYLEQLDDILQRLSYLDSCKYDLFVTMSELNPQAHEKIIKFNPNATLWQTPNLGYDIGPFIDFLHKIKLDDYDYILKIHTKRMDEKCYSLFNGKWFNSKTWREMLLDSVLFSSTAVRKNLDLMKNDKVIGMIGNFYTLTDEKIYLPHKEKIKKEMSKLGLSIPSDLHFVAGTMFLVRAQLLKPFLVYNIKDFAKTDKRFRDNTLAHMCERLFCFAIAAQGYKIQGVKYRHYWQETTIAAVKRFLFQKKITHHGKLIIKICKIPIYIRKVRNV